VWKFSRNRAHAVKKVPGPRAPSAARTIPDLRARNQDGDSFGESHHHRPRKYFTIPPRPVAPIITRISPANIVHVNKPSSPYFEIIPSTTTKNAPVGPPIVFWIRPKPKSKSRNDRAVNPRLRRNSRCNSKRHRQRSATKPHRYAAIKSAVTFQSCIRVEVKPI